MAISPNEFFYLIITVVIAVIGYFLKGVADSVKGNTERISVLDKELGEMKIRVETQDKNTTELYEEFKGIVLQINHISAMVNDLKLNVVRDIIDDNTKLLLSVEKRMAEHYDNVEKRYSEQDKRFEQTLKLLQDQFVRKFECKSR